MQGRGGVIVVAFLALAALMLPSVAFSERPTLARTQEALCVAAGERGDAYRPAFCDPLCTCSQPLPVSLASVDSCVQRPSGWVDAVDAFLTSAVCAGTCITGDMCLDDIDWLRDEITVFALFPVECVVVVGVRKCRDGLFLAGGGHKVESLVDVGGAVDDQERLWHLVSPGFVLAPLWCGKKGGAVISAPPRRGFINGGTLCSRALLLYQGP